MLRNLKRNDLYCLLSLIALIGYPKFPFTNIPIGLPFLLSPKLLVKAYFTRHGILLIAPSLIFILYCVLRALSSPYSSASDLSFIVSFGYKLLIAPVIAQVIKSGYSQNPAVLSLYLLIQSILIIISVVQEPVYKFMLLVQGTNTADIFSSIYQQRGIGFGVIHNEGGAFLFLIWALMQSPVAKENLSHFKQSLNLISIIPSIVMSRTNVIAVLIYAIIARNFKLVFLFVASGILLFSLSDSSHKIYNQLFEIFINYQDSGIASTRSTDAILRMTEVQMSYQTIMIGDGIFRNDDGTFYQDVDIGFLRLVLFGGIPCMLLYVLANMGPVILSLIDIQKRIPRLSSAKAKHLAGYQLIIIPLSFILFNIKGLLPVSWASIAANLLLKG